MDTMNATTVERLLTLTAESNLTMRNQIKRQQLSLHQLERSIKERKLSKPKMIVAPGKMLIKAKGKLVMRVRNEKAIADEIDKTNHKEKEKTVDEELPSFNTKNAPNLIIQSQIQNTPSPAAYDNRPENPPIVYSHHPAPGAHGAPTPYPPGAVPVYYAQPPAHVMVQKPVKYMQPPVQFVEEYVEERPTVYKVRKPYSRSHYVHPDPVIVYERERSPSREYRSRPVEYRRAPPSPESPWRYDSSPPRSSHYSPHHSPALPRPHNGSHHSNTHSTHPSRGAPPPSRVVPHPSRVAPHPSRSAPHHPEQVTSYTTSKYRQKAHHGGHYASEQKTQHGGHYASAQKTQHGGHYAPAGTHYQEGNWKRPTTHHRRSEISSGTGVIKHDIRAPLTQIFKVLVSNLHPSVSVQDIEELFNAIDTVEHIQMLYPGVAEVTYLSEESAAVSVDRYHNRDLDGQPMQISYSADQIEAPAPRREQRVKTEPKTPTRILHPASSQHYSPRKPKTRGRAKQPGPTRRPPLSDTESTHSFTVTM